MSHKIETDQHIRLVAYYMQQVLDNLIKRMEEHDQSKLDAPENDILQANPLRRDIPYGSDEYKKRLQRIMPAIEHHYRANDHHPEHHANGMEGMSLMSLIEMVCDWKAASMRQKNGSILKSVRIGQERHDMSEELKAIIMNTIKELGWTE